MRVILPDDLKRKSEEVHKYILPNGDWNQGALQLYEKVGFTIRSKEKIR